MTDIKQLPGKFLEEMKSLLGVEYDSYLASFQESWKPGLRVNTLKITPEALRDLVPWNLDPVPWTHNGFYYGGQDGEVERPRFCGSGNGGAPGKESVRPSKHPAYYCGLYYLQEPSAMTPAALLPVAPGERVLDLCAAPGGKSTELGSRLRGQGLLVSNDISYSRARALLKNLELAGIPNICVTSESPEKLAGVWPEFFDKILVDAPCSGEGMFRRDDDMVKDWDANGPAHYAPLQRSIAAEAVKMLKPGGMLLYSTCTFSRAEDEETIEYILEQYPQMELCPLDLAAVPGAADGFGLPGCMRLFPHRLKGEGHFLALLRKRKGNSGESAAGGRMGPASGPEDRTVCASGLGDRTVCVSGPEDRMVSASGPGERTGRETSGKRLRELEKQEDLMKFLKFLSLDLDYGRMVVHQDNVYYLPQGLEWNLPLRFLRTGLHLGEIKKGRFEPSQALAMALKPSQFGTVVRLPREDERVLRYLKGETVALKGEEGPMRGWCLVAMEDYPMGWAKGTGMSLKNKYYPGWRWQ